MPSHQLQGQLQTEHSVDTVNLIKDKHNMQTKTNYRQTLEKGNTLIQEKRTNKKDEEKYIKNVRTRN